MQPYVDLHRGKDFEAVGDKDFHRRKPTYIYYYDAATMLALDEDMALTIVPEKEGATALVILSMGESLFIPKTDQRAQK